MTLYLINIFDRFCLRSKYVCCRRPFSIIYSILSLFLILRTQWALICHLPFATLNTVADPNLFTITSYLLPENKSGCLPTPNIIIITQVNTICQHYCRKLLCLFTNFYVLNKQFEVTLYKFTYWKGCFFVILYRWKKREGESNVQVNTSKFERVNPMFM